MRDKKLGNLTRRGCLAGMSVAAMAGTATASALAQTQGAPAVLAPKPPMGWNSWNSFATTITEAQALETAAIMARTLLPFGYDIFTIDIQWYEPNASSYEYAKVAQPTLDGYGRLLPAPNRFASSARGRGFKPIADKVHALGLKFGVHLMRGIPRLAVERNLPVLGTTVTARQITDTSSICPWNPDMYGVDMRKAGAQAYYDSVFALLAAWGVDFVKMDDMSRPYDAHAPEIEAAHTAIARSGRAMILSLSPGETPVARADHVKRFAQMWRISDDFWDEWPQLAAQFTRLENWNASRVIGHWPDADMLPLGRLALGVRNTKFTSAEQRTLMTLWCIARSPLIMGGDLRHLDSDTLSLLTNREVLAVNQDSFDNQPHFLQDGWRVWTARAPSGGTYMAVFNTMDRTSTLKVDLAYVGVKTPVRARSLWDKADMGVHSGTLSIDVVEHGAVLLLLLAA